MNNLDFQHVQDDNFRSLVNALPRNVQAKVLKQFEYLMTIVQPHHYDSKRWQDDGLYGLTETTEKNQLRQSRIHRW